MNRGDPTVKVLDLMMAVKDALKAPAPASDVEFFCDLAQEPDPFPGFIICGWCGGSGCPECEGAGRVAAV